MRSVKLTLEYDGSGLCGWQRQNNGATVQQYLEEALSAMLGAPTAVTGASRTDAGVHALGQVANFTTERDIPLDGFRRGLSSTMPDAITVVDAEDVSPAFHARFSARGKHYRYQILARQNPSPLRSRTTWHRPTALDVHAMSAAAQALVGEHDFTSFRAADCAANTAIRRITRIDVTRGPTDMVEIHVWGNAFLRNMVRILVGTLVEVGHGRRGASSMTALLDGRDRSLAGQTAPARGLTLVRVFYAPDSLPGR